MTSFKVMSWNVENLYPAGSPYGPETQAEYEQKLSGLAEVILQLDPDLVALQEIGDLDALADLTARLEDRYPHTATASPDSRGIRVGYLSKLEIAAEPEEISTFPPSGLASVPGIDRSGNPKLVTEMSRPALLIAVTPQPGQSVYLLNAHLKSKLLSFPSASGQPRFAPKDEDERARVAGFALLKRTAEAVALRVAANRILEKSSQRGLILLGDLNDVPEAATTQILYGPGGSQIGTPGFGRPDRGDDTRLFNLDALIAPERQFSRIYQGQGELIDHILASIELMPGTPPNLPTVDSHIDIFGKLPSITDNPSDRRSNQDNDPKVSPSDHTPITALFQL
ncbi:MAG: endonuclease/exonuclease/phosphatase family protein [Elainella sp.]